jgi:hypothetical protein
MARAAKLATALLRSHPVGGGLTAQEILDFGHELEAARRFIVQRTAKLLLRRRAGKYIPRFVFYDVAKDVREHKVLLVDVHHHFLHLQTLSHDRHPVVGFF